MTDEMITNMEQAKDALLQAETEKEELLRQESEKQAELLKQEQEKEELSRQEQERFEQYQKEIEGLSKTEQHEAAIREWELTAGKDGSYDFSEFISDAALFGQTVFESLKDFYEECREKVRDYVDEVSASLSTEAAEAERQKMDEMVHEMPEDSWQRYIASEFAKDDDVKTSRQLEHLMSDYEDFVAKADINEYINYMHNDEQWRGSWECQYAEQLIDSGIDSMDELLNKMVAHEKERELDHDKADVENVRAVAYSIEYRLEHEDLNEQEAEQLRNRMDRMNDAADWMEERIEEKKTEEHLRDVNEVMNDNFWDGMRSKELTPDEVYDVYDMLDVNDVRNLTHEQVRLFDFYLSGSDYFATHPLFLEKNDLFGEKTVEAQWALYEKEYDEYEKKLDAAAERYQESVVVSSRTREEEHTIEIRM